MSAASPLSGWVFRLPPAETRDVPVEKDLKVPMRDGVVLLANRMGGEPTGMIKALAAKRDLQGLAVVP